MTQPIRLIRFKGDASGIRELRSEKFIDNELERRAVDAANLAEAMYAARYGVGTVPVDVEQIDSDTNEPRARVAIIARHPGALGIEAKRRILYNALRNSGQFAPRNVKRKRRKAK